MKAVKISLNSTPNVQANVQSFVNTVSRFGIDFDLVSGRYIIDAKSMLGIFSLDLSKPLDLHIHTDEDAEEILTALAPFIVK